MPKLEHPKTGDVIETASNTLAVDLRANHGYQVVKETKPARQTKQDQPKPAEPAEKSSK